VALRRLPRNTFSRRTVFEIGGSLRTAREQRQLELSEVERATNIRVKYLAALEEERYDVLPGPAYAKGFLRTYADFLELDGSQFVEELNERLADEPPQALAPMRIERPRRLLTKRVVAIPVVVAIGLLVWLLSSGGGPKPPTAFAPPVTHVRVTTAAAPPARTAAAPKPHRARIAFVATRGSSWLSVRIGSSTGRVLYERTLQAGGRAEFAGAQLWIRIGAPSNLDATLNGKPVQLPTSVADVLVTPAALRPL
jgi:transcriptional regulator with XRE-family HTH domain